MAGLAEVIATYDPLVGVALGAGLTYGIGALNRRHQEGREDATRWYQARFDAYTAFSEAAVEATTLTGNKRIEAALRLIKVQGHIRLVGSPEASKAGAAVLHAAQGILSNAERFESRPLRSAIGKFETVVRNDLGHPSP